MKVSSFRLNGFNNAANNRVSFFVASFNSFLRQNQTSFVFSLIFSNKVLQWVSKIFVLVILRDQLHQIYMKKIYFRLFENTILFGDMFHTYILGSLLLANSHATGHLVYELALSE